MKARCSLVSILSAGLVLASLAGSAMAAEGVVIAPGKLSAPARAALVAEIDQARASAPAAFDAIRDLRAKLPELDARKRGRLAPITPTLKGLGRGALFPMLAELAVDASPRGDLTESAWTAWRVGLLEAVGTLRDARAEAVLRAAVDAPEADFAVMKAAVEALAKLGTDSVAAKLVAMSKVAGPRQAAVLAGMGDCRRAKVAEALSSAIAARPEAPVAKLLLRALGNVGSAWAWKTPIIAASGEEAQVRAAAAKALIGAFVAYEGEIRQDAANAILVVDDASTPALIAAARSKASPSLKTALDALAARFAKSPLH